MTGRDELILMQRWCLETLDPPNQVFIGKLKPGTTIKWFNGEVVFMHQDDLAKVIRNGELVDIPFFDIPRER